MAIKFDFDDTDTSLNLSGCHAEIARIYYDIDNSISCDVNVYSSKSAKIEKKSPFKRMALFVNIKDENFDKQKLSQFSNSILKFCYDELKLKLNGQISKISED